LLLHCHYFAEFGGKVTKKVLERRAIWED